VRPTALVFRCKRTFSGAMPHAFPALGSRSGGRHMLSGGLPGERRNVAWFLIPGFGIRDNNAYPEYVPGRAGKLGLFYLSYSKRYATFTAIPRIAHFVDHRAAQCVRARGY
jgi:hypothetical protein